MNDTKLLKGLKQRETWAWQAIRDRYVPSLWRFVYTQVHGNADIAEDIVSETILAFVRTVETLPADSCCIGGWLRRVAKNKAVDHHRATSRVRKLLAQAQQHHDADNRDDAMQSLMSQETQLQVREVLNSMQDQQRFALEWKYLEGLSVRQIASRLELTEKATEAVLYRARREFRKLFTRAESQPQSSSEPV